MKTKTFEIHPNLISDSVMDLLNDNKKITKKKIIDNINNSLRRIISYGQTDLCPFSATTYEELIGDEDYDFKDAKYTKEELDEICNRWINKFK